LFELVQIHFYFISLGDTYIDDIESIIKFPSIHSNIQKSENFASTKQKTTVSMLVKFGLEFADQGSPFTDYACPYKLVATSVLNRNRGDLTQYSAYSYLEAGSSVKSRTDTNSASQNRVNI